MTERTIMNGKPERVEDETQVIVGQRYEAQTAWSRERRGQVDRGAVLLGKGAHA